MCKRRTDSPAIPRHDKDTAEAIKSLVAERIVSDAPGPHARQHHSTHFFALIFIHFSLRFNVINDNLNFSAWTRHLMHSSAFGGESVMSSVYAQI